MPGMGRLRALVWGLSLLALPRTAAATYSIVAADTETREVGGAGTSCLSGADVYMIYGSVPGVGALHAQSTFSEERRDLGVALVAQGLVPADVISALSDEATDSEAQRRQFGVVDVAGRTSGFTGSLARAYAADSQGALGTFHYSVQGNILTSGAVLSQAAEAFEASGCDLAERLMRALEAGGMHAEGDSRCTEPRQIPSDSAFLQVDRPDEPAGSYLELHVPTADENPLPQLRSLFDEWRLTHPCPAAGNDSDPNPLPGTSETPSRTQAGGSGCGVAPAAADASALFWALGALLLAPLRRWKPWRFRC